MKFSALSQTTILAGLAGVAFAQLNVLPLAADPLTLDDTTTAAATDDTFATGAAAVAGKTKTVTKFVTVAGLPVTVTTPGPTVTAVVTMAVTGPTTVLTVTGPTTVLTSTVIKTATATAVSMVTVTQQELVAQSTHSADVIQSLASALPTSASTPVNDTAVGVLASSGGVGTEPISPDGWRDTTITWYANSDMTNPACYNGATMDTTNHTGTAPVWKQPLNTDLVAAVVHQFGYAQCYDYIELANGFVLNKPVKSVIIRVIDFCASGCDNGLNKTWFDMSTAAFSRLASLNVGQLNVKWRAVNASSILPADISHYPVYPTS